MCQHVATTPPSLSPRFLRRKKKDNSQILRRDLERKTKHQGLTQLKTEGIYVFTKTSGEKTIRETSSTVEVVKMKSDLSKAERALMQDKELVTKLQGSCSTPGIRTGGVAEAES